MSRHGRIRALQIERQQPSQNVVVTHVVRPAIGVKHGGVEGRVQGRQLRRRLVVEVGQRAFFSCASLRPGGLSQASRQATSALAASPITTTRGSSAGSRPGGQGKAKASKVLEEL